MKRFLSIPFLVLLAGLLMAAGCMYLPQVSVPAAPQGTGPVVTAVPVTAQDVPSYPVTTATPSVECRQGMTSCNGYCRDLSLDIGNCGSCGNACPAPYGNICRQGTCVCKEGLSRCGESCWDLLDDNRNCGACGRTCPKGTFCNNGVCNICVRGQVECVPGQCTNLSSDARNCGACRIVCPAGQRCISGRCVGSPCSAPLVYCNGACRDLSTDRANCGACGHSCGNGMVCRSGTCGPIYLY